ncbi:o-succinylbenzoate--CoA ligase [Microbacterium sp. LWH7-1.2]|jgi:fatty-acyl-CoA synthase|uniref:o-succinylbenzoate--CoA ligase n=1 Tax=Microbacterium sp. LWH7-1.2 TaxID=3135257 RepID=UPI0031387A8D
MCVGSIGDWLVKRRLKSPEKTAIISAGHALTYREFADSADGVASLLAEQGIVKGDRVAVLGNNSAEFLVLMFGVLRIGAVLVPVNVRLAAPEISHVLRDSGARMLLHDAEFTTTVGALEASAVEHVMELGQGTLDRPGLGRLIVPVAGGADAAAGGDDPAVILYTSGTTGKPKGAVLSHANLTWNSLNCVVDYDIVTSDVTLLISPLFHAAALGMGALPAILKGATLVVERAFDAGRVLNLIESLSVTMVSGVPTTFQLLAEHPRWADTNLTSLRTITCGGSAVPSRVLDAFEERGLSFSQGYGLTETAPGATSLAPTMTHVKQGSVGLPHFFADVRVVDDAGGLVPIGALGEIQIAGPNVFLGYHNLAEASAAAFTTDGWFRSGDIGYFDEDGYLFIADRLKDLIISGGENIYPAEIEDLLYSMDGVTGAAVVGAGDDRWGEVPVAVLTVREGTAVTLDDVRAHLQGHLARYKLPKAVMVVEELPRTASGKVRKAELRARVAEEEIV